MVSLAEHENFIISGPGLISQMTTKSLAYPITWQGLQAPQISSNVFFLPSLSRAVKVNPSPLFNNVFKHPLVLPLLFFSFSVSSSWLVGCFWFNGPLRQYFSLYRVVSRRERKRRERIDESKNVQTPPPAPTASAVGPCPTVIQIVGRPGTGCLPSPIAPPDHPRVSSRIVFPKPKDIDMRPNYFSFCS